MPPGDPRPRGLVYRGQLYPITPRRVEKDRSNARGGEGGLEATPAGWLAGAAARLRRSAQMRKSVVRSLRPLLK